MELLHSPGGSREDNSGKIYRGSNSLGAIGRFFCSLKEDRFIGESLGSFSEKRFPVILETSGLETHP